MSLLRFISRTAFASAFIADGVSKVTKPVESAADAASFTDKVAPLVQRAVPAQYSSMVPEKAETWVRIGGVLELVGGAMFATGLGRRLGAVLLAKASLLNTAIAMPSKNASAAAKSAARPQVLANVALLGASLLATQDLEGRPSLSWRAGQAAKKVDKQITDGKQDLSRTAKKAARKADKQAKALAKSSKKLGRKLDSVVS